MSLAATRTPAGVAVAAEGVVTRRTGTRRVWQWELQKLRRQLRTRIVAVLCVGTPFAFVAILQAQTSVPSDTLFGRWVHESGFAVPLVILGFAGMWALPLLSAVVAGDIFSSEDHFGTWKTVLTRSASRGQLFVGKALAVATYSLAMVGVLAVTSLAAGLLVGHQTLVGLSGQMVPAGRAAGLVLASWATALLPVLGFSAVAVLLSIVSRNSAVGMGGPVLIGLVMQLLTLVNGPDPLRVALLATPLVSWHGFWATPAFYGPFWQGAAVSLAWIVVCTAAAWAAFRRRDIRVA